MKENIISLVGMSGVGKTTFASQQNPSEYFHYSVDYVIGKYFLKDEVLNNISKILQNNGFFKEAILTNKVIIDANIKVKDLSLISNYLGKFGSTKNGGLNRDEFLKRQRLYCEAEKKATLYLEEISDKIFSMGYKYIINDLTGSICEIIDFDNKNDKISDFLKKTTIKYMPASREHLDNLVERANKSPKPLLFNEIFFNKLVNEFLNKNKLNNEKEINPDEFCRFTFPQLLDYRMPKYEKLSKII